MFIESVHPIKDVNNMRNIEVSPCKVQISNQRQHGSRGKCVAYPCIKYLKLQYNNICEPLKYATTLT